MRVTLAELKMAAQHVRIIMNTSHSIVHELHTCTVKTESWFSDFLKTSYSRCTFKLPHDQFLCIGMRQYSLRR